MKALIYKDLFVLKQKGQLATLILNLLMVIPIGFFFQNLYGLALIIILSYPIGGSVFIQVVMEKEERTNFDKTVISLPVTKAEIILAKYITSFIYFGIHMLFGLIYTFIHIYVIKSVSLEFGLLLWGIGLLIGTMMISINSVGYILLGAKKGTFVYMVILLLSIIGYVVTFLGFDIKQVLTLSSTVLMLIACLITILCLIVSYFTSLKIFTRKYS
ncbi:ABC-2 transporter permease [Beduini massiliensis]|uniref:ABC-2 transporter permease n=1 Tax=Beduini massiliensis TaxID=1585974 RepID=UPI00059AA4D5|nr:ABC-2 transporter permease [Beduini massiliensis]